jgi:hypothetical protein
MKKITIKTIPHSEQRYDTCGDWWFEMDGSLEIRVSALKDERFEELIAVHELWEAILCRHRNISEKSVTEFDKQWLNKNATGEPGDDSLAPYCREHCSATGVERMLASDLDVYWEEYEADLKDLQLQKNDQAQEDQEGHKQSDPEL